MKVSDRNAELNTFFPFSRCGDELRAKALELGKCVKYESGESVLLSGSPAKHCGLIIDGQAVAFKLDSTGRRYQLCLEEGCFIGLETLTPDSRYTSKITALTDLEVFFWNEAGIVSLMEMDPDFRDALQMLDDGRTYQEQWLVPETDITDPVLCSLHTHWLSVITPALIIIPLLIIGLAACGMLIRNYPAAWLLVIALLAGAGSLLYRTISSRFSERVILTSKNLILIPGNNETPMTVARLSRLQTLNVEQNFFERLIDSGRICIMTDERQCSTPPVRCPHLAASLIHGFAERASSGRPIPMGTGRKLPQKEQSEPEKIPQPVPEVPVKNTAAPAVQPFWKMEFHAHWALLLRMLFAPVLFIAAALIAAHLFRNNINADFIRTVLFAAIVLAGVSMIFRFSEWRNNHFTIEEDRVRDYNKKPFSNEELNAAMIHKIQSVRFEKKGFFQLLFNYGTVYILAGEGELTFDYVSDPQKVQEQIMDACARYEANSKMEEEARRRAYISDLVREIQNESGGMDMSR